jgi:hypothetical protein
MICESLIVKGIGDLKEIPLAQSQGFAIWRTGNAIVELKGNVNQL